MQSFTSGSHRYMCLWYEKWPQHVSNSSWWVCLVGCHWQKQKCLPYHSWVPNNTSLFFVYYLCYITIISKRHHQKTHTSSFFSLCQSAANHYFLQCQLTAYTMKQKVRRWLVAEQSLRYYPEKGKWPLSCFVPSGFSLKRPWRFGSARQHHIILE